MYSTNTHLYWDPPLLSSELSIYRIKRCVKYGSFHGEHYSLLGESEPPVSIMQGSTGSLLLEKYKLSMTQRWAESFDHISEPVLNLDKLDAKFSHVISFLQEIQPRKGFLDSLQFYWRLVVTWRTVTSHSTRVIWKVPFISILSPSIPT